MKRDYFEGADVAVTICAKDGTILDMNGKSKRTFLKPGQEGIIGKNVLDCHPDTKFGASPPSLTAQNPVSFSEHNHPKTVKTL